MAVTGGVFGGVGGEERTCSSVARSVRRQKALPPNSKTAHSGVDWKNRPFQKVERIDMRSLGGQGCKHGGLQEQGQWARSEMAADCTRPHPIVHPHLPTTVTFLTTCRRATRSLREALP